MWEQKQLSVLCYKVSDYVLGLGDVKHLQHGLLVVEHSKL